MVLERFGGSVPFGLHVRSRRQERRVRESDVNTTRSDDCAEAELLAEYEENGVMRPDERLSEAFPDPFQAYCEQFVAFFPKSRYFVKTTYDNGSKYGGWPLKKSRRTGQPLRLIDNGNWLNKTDCIERHLDNEQWTLFKNTTDVNFRGGRGDFYWLGLNAPRSTRWHGIDLDNKRLLGLYGNPVLPVVHMPLEHFKAMKRIYDAFPDRIWCITSETLGLDIIERHDLQNTKLVHDRTKRQLARIGLGATEVHPMLGRCKRLPFGEHYRTITQDGVLHTWQTQLSHFVNPGPTPEFEHIGQTLIEAVLDQWKSWQRWGDAQNRRLNTTAVISRYAHEIRETRRWLNDGCPLTDPVHVSICEDVPVATEAASNLPSGTRRNPSRKVCDFNLQELRNGNWAKGLERIARNGLPCDDSIGNVAHEMAKYLWWIERYELSEDEREREVLRLLIIFVRTKHNGFITRWNNGQQKDVFKQLSRCLQLARRLNVEHRTESLERFAVIRQKRQQGEYHHVIRLEPLITGCLPDLDTADGQSHQDSSGSPLSSSPSPSSIYFSVGGLTELDAPLPQTIVDLIDQHRGRARPHRYATRLLNHLLQTQGIARLPHRALSQLLGYEDRKRTTSYNNILIRAGLLEKDHYVRGQRTCGYSLSKMARRLFIEDKQQDSGVA